MESGRTVGSDAITVEVWSLTDISVAWLAKLFYKIIDTRKMLVEWKISTVVPIIKI